MRHRLYLASALLLVVGIYAPSLTSFFYGYDDFYEAHRTAFEDTSDPSAMIRTTHFHSAKYRPAARVLNYITYHLGNGSPLGFRIRNLVGHVGSAAMLYLLGMFLFRSRTIALSAALLFGLHPLANQSILAASWTITPAALLLLGSLMLFLRAGRSPAFGWPLLGALLTLLVSLFIYEAGIVVIGLWFLYVIFLRPPKRFVLAAAGGLALVLGGFFLARSLVVQFQPEHGSPSTIAHNLALFGGALLTAPADSILLNDWWGTPLPSEILLSDPSSFLAPLLTAALILLGAAWLAWRRWSSPSVEAFPWLACLILVGSIPLWLLPFLLFTPHASETYLYLPAASFSLLVAAFLHHTLPRPKALLVLGCFAALFSVSSYNRSLHVTRGAVIAQRIVNGFSLPPGQQRVVAAEAEPPLPRYGLYSYRGLSTIDVGDPGIPALQYALQLATGNPGISAQVVSTQAMAASTCPATSSCYWVYGDGRVVLTEGGSPAPQ